MAMAKKAEAAVEVADAGLGVVQKAQAALIKKLQKALDDGASKADAKKIVGNAAGVDPKKPGVLKRIKEAESRLIDFVTRQQRTVKGQPFKKGKEGLGNRFQSPKDIRVKRGAARTIVYGGGATALGTAGNAASGRPTAEEVRDSTGETEKARIMREAAAQLKKRKTDEIKGQDKANSKGKLFKKFRPFGGVLARALLGDDEKFGGERGAIDFIRLKKKKNKTPTEKEKMEVMMRAEKKKAAKIAAAEKEAKGLKNGGMAKKPVKKNMGGMMKKKGYSKGGAMKKKGYANGGMAKKGYANGGPAKKTTAKKTASRGKARGVGAATRGYGKAMR